MKDFHDEDVSVYVFSPDKVVVAINNMTLNVGLKNDESTSKYEKTVSMKVFEGKEKTCCTRSDREIT